MIDRMNGKRITLFWELSPAVCDLYHMSGAFLCIKLDGNMICVPPSADDALRSFPDSICLSGPVTTTKGYVGFGSQPMRTDDNLVVISESWMPVVLHQSSTGWSVGPCHASGTIDDEAAKDCLKLMGRTSTFQLQ